MRFRVAGIASAVIVAAQTGGVVRGGIGFQRTVRIMAGKAGQARIADGTPTTALLQPVRREPHRNLADNSTELDVSGGAVTGAAEIDRLRGSESGRIHDIWLLGIVGLQRREVCSPWSVAAFAGHSWIKLRLG